MFEPTQTARDDCKRVNPEGGPSTTRRYSALSGFLIKRLHIRISTGVNVTVLSRGIAADRLFVTHQAAADRFNRASNHVHESRSRILSV